MQNQNSNLENNNNSSYNNINSNINSNQFEIGKVNHLSSLTLIYEGISKLPSFIIPFYLIFNNNNIEESIYFILFAIIFLISIPSIILNWYLFSYILSDKEIIIRSGILNKQTRHIPYIKIHNVSISQNFLQKIFRIARVSLETAGDNKTEGELRYLTYQNAEVIKNQINRLAQDLQTTNNNVENNQLQNKVGESGEFDEFDENSTTMLVNDENQENKNNNYAAKNVNQINNKEQEEREIFSLNNKELIKFSSIRARPIFLVVAFWAANLINQLNIFGGSGFIEDFEQNYINNISNYGTFEQVLIFTLSFIGILFLSWLMDFVITFNSFYNFNLKRFNNKFIIKTGFTTTNQSTIPINKIQLVQIKTNLLKRYFNFYTLFLDTAGFDSTKNKTSEVVVPFARYERILDIIKEFLNLEENYQILKISPKVILRRTIKLEILLIIIASLFVYLFNYYFLIMLALTPLIYYYNYLYFKNFSYSTNDKFIIIRRGVYFKSELIIPIDKIQSVSQVSNYFQRRLGLSNIIIDTAANDTFSKATIPDLDKEDSDFLYQNINEITINIIKEKRRKK